MCAKIMVSLKASSRPWRDYDPTGRSVKPLNRFFRNRFAESETSNIQFSIYNIQLFIGLS